MNYEIRANVLGGKVVIYGCDGCGTPMESPLSDAGRSFACPTCGVMFHCPGVQELEADRRAADADRANALEALGDASRERMNRPPRRPRRATSAARQAEMVWRGKMFCPSCGYSWMARRNTPPARCPSCSRRGVEAVREPKGMGCGTILVVVGAGFLILAIVGKVISLAQ